MMVNFHRMFQRLLLLTLFSLLPAQLSAQAFEAAAIHPSKPSPGCFSMLPSGGMQYQVTCVPLRALIGLAFAPDELEGPDAALHTMYDIRATIPAGTASSTKTVNAMLRTLLIERFHLVFHTTAKRVHGYQLVVGPHGSKLPVTAVKRSNGHTAGEPMSESISADRVQGRALDAGAIAGMLSLALHMPVNDATGLTGVYDLNLRFAPETSVDSDQPPLRVAVEEQLGLVLKPAQVPIKVMVIDHVDSTPTEN